MKNLIQIPDFDNVKFYDTRVRLSLDSALDEASSVELLADIRAKSPDKFQPVQAESDRPPSSLINNPELDNSKRIKFDISDSHILSLRFGSKVLATEMGSCISDVFETALQLKRLQVSRFNFADIVHIFDVKFLGNHHALLGKIYYKGSILEHVFPMKDFVNSSINVAGAVSGTSKRVCLVHIDGKTGMKEILSGEYDPEKVIDVMVGYAQFKEIPSKNIAEFMLSLLFDARQYVVSNILEKFVKPLDKAVGEQEGIVK